MTGTRVEVRRALLLPGFLDGRDSPGVAALDRDLRGAGLACDVLAVTNPADVAVSRQLSQVAGALADDRPTVLVGHCYGALLACLAAARHPAVTHVVALMPTRCFIWPDAYDPRRDTWRGGDRRFERSGGDPVDVPYVVVEDALRYDLPAVLRKLMQPVLFVSGLRDEAVPAASVRALAAECGSPGAEYRELDVQHDYRDHPDQIATVDAAVLDWLGRVSPAAAR